MTKTRAQIQAEINTLTRHKNNYISERDKYKNSLNYANKLITNLKNSNDYLTSSNDYMKRFFTINGNTADNGKINNTTKEIDAIIEKMNNTIIPKINSNINVLNSKIKNTTKEINILRREYESAGM